MSKIPSLVDLLKAGMHFGHKDSKWHPKMKPFIFTKKNNIHIIDLQETVKKIEEVMEYVTKEVSEGKKVLFVGTKPQAKSFISEQATRCEMPYICERWIGGLLTNFSIISRLPKKLVELKKKQASGELEKYTKKEQLEFQKEIERLTSLAGGIENVEKIPDIIFVIDLKHEKTAVTEANKKGIPVIAICDTNVNPKKADYIIPANDDAVKSLEIIIRLVADAVIEGKKDQQQKQAAESNKAAK